MRAGATYGAQAGYLQCNEALKTVFYVRICGNMIYAHTIGAVESKACPFFNHLPADKTAKWVVKVQNSGYEDSQK